VDLSFKRDYKRIRVAPRHRDVETLLPEIAGQLADESTPERKTSRPQPRRQLEESSRMPLKPDLLLIYKKPDENTLRLVRMGSHSELFAK